MSRDMTRRNFVAAAAATGAVAAVGMAGCAKTEEPTDAQEPQPLGSGVDPFADCTKVYGCCSPECQHHLLTGYVRDGKLVKVPAYHVSVVDTTAAGDAYVGELVAHLAFDGTLEESMKYASAAAAICITRVGAQETMPRWDEVEEFVKMREQA